MNNKLEYHKPIILFIGVVLTSFGMLAFGYFMGMMEMGGERKVIAIILSLLGGYIGVMLLCDASSYKTKGRKRK